MALFGGSPLRQWPADQIEDISRLGARSVHLPDISPIHLERRSEVWQRHREIKQARSIGIAKWKMPYRRRSSVRVNTRGLSSRVPVQASCMRLFEPIALRVRYHAPNLILCV